jgi:branched-chain amino acid transport system ATP-binding protein
MLLEIKDLVVKYGHITALKGISFNADKGQITTLIGSNGAGKSTLLKTLSGLLKPTSGSILYEGKEIGGLEPDKIVHFGISQCMEGRKVFPRQTVYENLKIGAFIRNDRNIEKDIEKYFAMFPRLKERKNQKAGSLSGGEQQMLVICRALMSQPKFLLMDEPSMGLAPKVVNEIFNIIKQVHSMGTSILLIEQNAKQALKIADYGYILEVGNIVGMDTAEKLLSNETVQKAYLGLE